MKAIVVDEYGGPEVMKLREADVPRPGAGEILVRLTTSGVNPVDTYLRSGTQGYAPPLPWIPGLDGAGFVEETGEGVTGPAKGDAVYVYAAKTGTCAEYCLCDASRVFPVPVNLDADQAACLGVPYFTAARALFTRGGAAAGMKVLIHGASGGVGMACLQLAALKGLETFGTAGSAEGAELVRSTGAAFFSHRDPHHAEAVRDAAGGGVDLIVEMLADANLDADLKILGPGGRIVVVGSRGSVEITPRDLLGGETSISGCRILNAAPDELAGYARLTAEGVRAGNVRPPVAAVFNLARAGEAHEAVMKGPHLGNIVLRVTEG